MVEGHPCGHAPQVVIAVTSAPNAIVGLYSLELKSGRHLLKPEDSMVYLLFNPWCPGEMGNVGTQGCSHGPLGLRLAG